MKESGSFSHYKGLREYKEKFDPVWYNKYLIYQHDYDLLKLPALLAKSLNHNALKNPLLIR